MNTINRRLIQHGKKLAFLLRHDRNYPFDKHGHKFFRSRNGVWLTDYIDVKYITII